MRLGRPKARSRKELGHHRRYKRGVLALSRVYAVGTICADSMSCSRQFHYLARLVRHLNRCDECLQTLVAACDPPSHEEVAAAEAQAVHDRRDARAAGLRLLDAYLPAMRVQL